MPTATLAAVDPRFHGDDSVGSCARPENLAQRLEKVESAPGIASAATAVVDVGPSIANVAAHGSRPRAATDCLVRPIEGQGLPVAASPGDSRPENLAQRLEKVQSAPGIAPAAMAGADAGPSIANVAARGSRPRAATDCLARPPQGQGLPVAASPGDARPENLAQRLEKVESAPGMPSAATAVVDVGPSIANVAAHGSRPRAATDCVALPPQGLGFPAAGSTGDARPENPPQRLEKVESAPGIASAATAGADAGPSIANVAARWSRFSEEAHGVAAQPRGRGLRPPPRRATLARKIRRNALERLNPRPRGAAPGGGSSPARRSRAGSSPGRPGDARQRHDLLTAGGGRESGRGRNAQGLNR